MGRRANIRSGWLQMGLALLGVASFLAVASYGNMQLAALVGILFTGLGWALYFVQRREDTKRD